MYPVVNKNIPSWLYFKKLPELFSFNTESALILFSELRQLVSVIQNQRFGFFLWQKITFKL